MNLQASVTIPRRPKDGETGDGIVNTVISYAKSESGTTPPITGWTSILPTPTQGWYLWTRTVTTYRIRPSTTTYSVSSYAKDGKDGENGENGLPGQIPIQKEWKVGDTHRNTDEIIDYIYVRGANKNVSYYYKRATKGTTTAGAPPTGGATPTGYLRIDWLKELAVNVLLAEEASVAGFIFKDNQLISVRGTVGGVDADYSGQANFIPNLILDGTEGDVKITGTVNATSGSFKGHIEANSGTIENVTISNANINAISVDGLLKVSTGFEGSLTNNNLFWIAPSVSNASAYTPSVDFDSKGKIIKLYNSSFTKTHVIALRYAGFVLVNGVLQLTDFTLDDPDKGVIKENIELPPRANIEISCFELPPGTYKSGGSSARYYHRVLGWVMTDRSLFERIDYKTIGSDTFAIPSNTNYTLRQSSPLSILTSVGTNSTLIRIYMDNTNQVRDGTIKWILNSTPTTVNYGLTGNIRNHSEGFEKLQAWSITPFIHYGGYWYKHSDRK